MQKSNGEIKARGATFVRFYPSDWRSGCIGMTLEQEGLYWRICAHYYETGRRLPLDDAAAAHRLGLNPKNYRRVRDQLLTQGKITRHEDGYANERSELELRNAVGHQKQAADGVGATRDGPRSEHQDGGGEIPGRGDAGAVNSESIGDQSGVDRRLIADQSGVFAENDEQNQWPSKEPVASSQEPVAKAQKQDAARLPEISDLKKLSDRLHAVAGPCLSSQAIAPGLISMMIPQMWLDQGCDLERDVLPVLETFAARGKRNVSSWDYFTKPVAEAKAKRLAGLPGVDLAQAAPQRKRFDRSKLVIVDSPPEAYQ